MTTALATPSLAAEPSAEELAGVRALYDEGRYPSAWRLAQELGAEEGRWTSTAARLLLGRLLRNVGAPRRGEAAILRAWRRDRGDPEASYYAAYTLFGERGPLAAWKLTESYAMPETAPLRLRADWLALQGVIRGQLRDFVPARELIARALALCPDTAWLLVERAHLLQLEDRPEEAVAVVHRALELRPFYRPAVQLLADLLLGQDRAAEALALLEEADRRLESSGVAAQLAQLLEERGQFAESRAAWERWAALCPCLEEKSRPFLAGKRSDLAYLTGDLPTAAREARAATPFHQRIADRLDGPREDRRVLLPVPVVRQHHLTCAPASLTMLCRFWGRDCDHVELANEICYDGTPSHRQRAWAEQRGWRVRELTVTFAAARALLDRGCPFALATVEATSAHLQLVTGYDARRGTILIRDPGLRHLQEALGEELIEHYAFSGPRGMVLVPEDEASRLDGLDLPDAGLHDRLHALEVALWRHDRAAAAAEAAALAAEAPGHRVALQAARNLAIYDQDPARILQATERLLQDFPGTACLELSKVASLSQLARRTERLAYLQELSRAPGASPAVWRSQALELLGDASEHPRIERLLRRARRRAPLDPHVLATTADLRWDQGRFAEALPLHRFATCLAATDERMARAWFAAARQQDRTDEALALLQERWERLGDRSAQPARTLFSALLRLDRSEEAFLVLGEALRRRKDDGELLLFAADAHGRAGRRAEAEALLARAEGKARRPDALASAAELATQALDLPRARQLYEALLELEPLQMRAHEALAALLAQTEGTAAAAAHLEAAVARHPHYLPLHQAFIRRLHDLGDPARAEGPLRRLLELHPADAYTHVELAHVLVALRRHDEAAAAAAEALRLDPQDPCTHAAAARVALRRGDLPRAREGFRAALVRSIDAGFALRGLLEASPEHAQVLEALAFAREELLRQRSQGDGILAWAGSSLGRVEPAEREAFLRQLQQSRGDLWQAWSALADHLIDHERVDEASALLQEATARFPLRLELWLDTARARAVAGDGPGEEEAIAQVLAIDPGHVAAVARRAQLHLRRAEFDLARRHLEEALARAPMVPWHLELLARALWLAGQRDEALAKLERAVQVDPSQDDAWELLSEWAPHLGRAGRVGELLEQVTAARPGQLAPWLRMARLLPAERLADRLQALERAEALEPAAPEVHELRASLLGEAGRWEEALQACAPPVYGAEPPPLIVRGRKAWVLAGSGDKAAAAALMRELVGVAPGYFWGWARLCDWCHELGDLDGMLEAARALCRLAPMDPQPLWHLGQALRARGDLEGARTAWSRALELRPDAVLPARSRFDLELHHAGDLPAAEAALLHLETHVGAADPDVVARRALLHLKQDQPALARAALEASLARDPKLPGHHELLARALWASGERAAACDRLETALGLDPEWDDAWERLAGWSSELGRVERMCELLRETGRTHGERPATWLRIARMLPEARLEERLHALERAEALAPRLPEVHELRIHLLGEARRWDEAERAAAPAVFGAEPIPLIVRGRAAWLLAARGDPAGAAQRMRQLVAEEPGYRWGWKRLCEWSSRAGDHAGELAAAEALLRLEPEDPEAHGCHGAALESRGDLDGARAAWRQALALGPTHWRSACSLFDLELREGKLVAAEEALGHLDRHFPGEAVVAIRGVDLAARQGRREAALTWLAKMAADRATDPALLGSAATIAEEAGWSASLGKVWREALALRDPCPEVGALHLRRVIAAPDPSEPDPAVQVSRLAARGELGRRALVGAIEALGERGLRHQLQELIAREQRQLASDTLAWTAVGYAWTILHEHRRGLAWLEGWEKREGVSPTALFYLASCQRNLGDAAAALRTHAAALSLPQDSTTERHRAWLAWLAAVEGQTARAREAAAALDREALAPFHLFVLAATQALLVAGEPGGFARGRERLAAARAACEGWPGNVELRRVHARSARQVAALAGGLLPLLWWLFWACRARLLRPGHGEG